MSNCFTPIAFMRKSPLRVSGDGSKKKNENNSSHFRNIYLTEKTRPRNQLDILLTDSKSLYKKVTNNPKNQSSPLIRDLRRSSSAGVIQSKLKNKYQIVFQKLHKGQHLYLSPSCQNFPQESEQTVHPCHTLRDTVSCQSSRQKSRCNSKPFTLNNLKTETNRSQTAKEFSRTRKSSSHQKSPIQQPSHHNKGFGGFCSSIRNQVEQTLRSWNSVQLKRKSHFEGDKLHFEINGQEVWTESKYRHF